MKTQVLKDKNASSEQISTDGVLLRTGHLSFERTFAHKKSFLNSDYSNSQLPIQHSVIQLFFAGSIVWCANVRSKER